MKMNKTINYKTQNCMQGNKNIISCSIKLLEPCHVTIAVSLHLLELLIQKLQDGVANLVKLSLNLSAILLIWRLLTMGDAFHHRLAGQEWRVPRCQTPRSGRVDILEHGEQGKEHRYRGPAWADLSGGYQYSLIYIT